jgi:hypothetical protein
MLRGMLDSHPPFQRCNWQSQVVRRAALEATPSSNLCLPGSYQHEAVNNKKLF